MSTWTRDSRLVNCATTWQRSTVRPPCKTGRKSLGTSLAYPYFATTWRPVPTCSTNVAGDGVQLARSRRRQINSGRDHATTSNASREGESLAAQRQDQIRHLRMAAGIAAAHHYSRVVLSRLRLLTSSPPIGGSRTTLRDATLASTWYGRKRHELGPNRRKLEATEGSRPAIMGQADRR